MAAPSKTVAGWMRDEPGLWFVISFLGSEHSARTRAAQLRRGDSKRLSPEEFDFRAGSVSGLPVVFARCSRW